MSKNGGETFNFIFHREAFVVSPSSFSIEKLVSDFSIYVYALAKPSISFFIVKRLWFRLLVFHRKTSARFFYLCLCMGRNFNVIFHSVELYSFAFIIFTITNKKC